MKRHRIDVVTDAVAWRRLLPGAPALLRRAATAALRAAGPDRPAELALVLSDDARQRVLNDRWRGKNKPTNVLAFPGADPAAPLLPRDAPLPLGDVVLAVETVVREAAGQSKPVGDHAAHLVIHGVLHLLGYDHRTARAAARMEALEVALLAELGIADPYRVRGRASSRVRSDSRAAAR